MEALTLFGKIMLIFFVFFLMLIMVSYYLASTGTIQPAYLGGLTNQTATLNATTSQFKSAMNANVVSINKPATALNFGNAIAWIAYYEGNMINGIFVFVLLVIAVLASLGAFFGFVIFLLYTFVPSMLSVAGLGFLGSILSIVEVIFTLLGSLWLVLFILEYLRGRSR